RVAALSVAAFGISIYAAKTSPATAPAFAAHISNDQKIIHALNRLTFGPRPEDIETVKEMGLRKWIDRQLHPDRIAENPVLEAKLAPLDTLRMTPAEMARNYPPPQLIKAMVEGKIPYPADAEQRLIVQKLARRYKDQLSQGDGGQPTLETVDLTEE